MNARTKNILICVAVVVACLAVGFFAGRATRKETTKIEVRYEKGETIHDTVTISEPVVVKPVDTANIIQQCVADGIYAELFPKKTVIDTQYIEVTREDTTAILADWATERTYSESLFDIDTLGKCDVSVSVQYNRLAALSYTYTPIQKTTTITTEKKRVVSPFIGLGVMTNPTDFGNSLMPSASVGIYIKERYGLTVQYARYIKNKENIVGLMLNYKW